MTNEGQGFEVHLPAEDGVDVVAEDTQQAAKGGEGKKGSFWRELPVLIVVALLLALLIKSFVVQAFYIPSESMEDTLLKNDRVLVNKLVYHVRDIERGDVVVFSGVDSWDPEVQLEEPSNPVAAFFRWVGTAFGVVPGEKDYIKRVIGVPGDTVKCCDAKGRITVNGTAIDEQGYLYPGDQPSQSDFEVTVPPDRLWVMGDHRSVSLDSRSHVGDPGGGTIPIDKVIGRAFVIVWPFDRAKILPIPDTFSQPALQAAAGAAPLAAGFVGAVPLVLLRRRFTRR
ncbi:signal peptidase I [Planotetraspora phitsanulokensis]|uniref:Signal peptidase I n=1 Tax=Planotetraspora phitsanulokensis TaxID=575192 RepID=A0A8J3UGK8_9ACTN|nr:signal peptidase I [Planotetraspora phitsanulokensis]